MSGIHHITAISGAATRNLDFYTRTLGLRLVRMLGQHQLGSQLELDGARGTRCSLRFAPKQYRESRSP